MKKLIDLYETQKEFRRYCKREKSRPIDVLEKIVQKWIRKQKRKQWHLGITMKKSVTRVTENLETTENRPLGQQLTSHSILSS